MEVIKLKRKHKYLFVAIIIFFIFVFSTLCLGVFSRGTIIVYIKNDTESEKQVGLSTSNIIYSIPSGSRKKIKCNTKDIDISLEMTYMDTDGKMKTLVLEEYVEKSYYGKIKVVIHKDEELETLTMDVENKISF